MNNDDKKFYVRALRSILIGNTLISLTSIFIFLCWAFVVLDFKEPLDKIYLTWSDSKRLALLMSWLFIQCFIFAGREFSRNDRIKAAKKP